MGVCRRPPEICLKRNKAQMKILKRLTQIKSLTFRSLSVLAILKTTRLKWYEQKSHKHFSIMRTNNSTLFFCKDENYKLCHLFIIINWFVLSVSGLSQFLAHSIVDTVIAINIATLLYMVHSCATKSQTKIRNIIRDWGD